MSAAPEIRFSIDGLNCGACVGRAEATITKVAGVQAARVNLADKSATVTLDDPHSGQGIADALSTAGYPAQPQQFNFTITGMTCASCVGRVETALMQVPGVLSATVNLLDGRANVATLGDSRAVQNVITHVGYGAALIADDSLASDHIQDEARENFRRFLIAAVLTLPVFVMEMGGHMFPAFHHWTAHSIGTPASWTIQFMLATLVLAWPGRGFFTSGIPALRRMAPDMNALVVLGTGAAWVFSTIALFVPGMLPAGTQAVYFEAAAVIVTLILLGRWLEARAKNQTGAAIRQLIGLQPQTARVLVDDQETNLPINEVRCGDIVIIRPGERIATDGIVHQGSSFVDESMISGEPVAVEKAHGDQLIGGTINQNGALQMQTTAVGADTMLARIVALVQDAQSIRLPVQNLVNRITLWFVPAVMGIAFVTVLMWLLFGPVPVLSYALVAGVSVLIVACPCAMGLATPTAIMVGTGRGASLGVLFRQGDALQRLQEVDVVAFDKTGTLTRGTPELTDVIPLKGSKEALLRDVAAVEAMSEHPLAQPILQAVDTRLPSVTDFHSMPGHGLSGIVDGRKILVGAARHLENEGVDPATLVLLADDLSIAGKTPILVAVDGVVSGVIGVADTVRPNAISVVKLLQSKGLKVAMITGDTAQTGAAIGQILGIRDIVAGVVPEGKVEAVRRLQTGGKSVAFVGDGINDAPALAAADVGIAIGTGTDIAIESADVVLMSGDPARVLDGLTVSRATMRNIKQNLFWAFGYNVLLIPVAAGGLLSPALAAGAMALSSVLVVANALRLRRVKGET